MKLMLVEVGHATVSFRCHFSIGIVSLLLRLGITSNSCGCRFDIIIVLLFHGIIVALKSF